MKAIVQREYGNAEQLAVGELERPVPGRGRVLVRVRAAGLDRGTWHLMTGEPLLMRPFTGMRRPRQVTPGLDLSGVVESVGEGVTTLKVGDEVLGTGRGALAEFAVAKADRLVAKPEALAFEEAAALPVSGATALQALRDVGRVQPGQRVLVTGASGGVGTYAVQLAVAMEARVTGVAGPTKLDLVRALGAEHVIDHTAGDFVQAAAATEPYDLIIDIAGSRPVRTLRPLLTPRGTLVIVGGEGKGRMLNGLERQLGATLLSPWVRHRLTTVVATARAEDLQTLLGFVHRGLLRPAVDRTFTLDETAKAMQHLADGHARGKVVVVP